MRSLNAIFLIVPILMVFTSCNKDDDNEPAPEVDMLYEKTFDSAEDWTEFDNPYASGKVENGEFVYEHKGRDSTLWTNLDLYGNLPPNYTLEMSLRLIESDDDFTYGLTFFRKDNYNYHYMFLYQDCYVLGYLYNYSHHNIDGPKAAECIHNNGDYNELKIVKSVTTLNYFINNIKVHEHDIEIQSSEGFGIRLISKGKVGIDYVRLYI